MPASYTHYCFGRDVLSALPPECAQRIQAHRPLFDLGIHGPDIFFFDRPLVKGSVSQVGYAMHDQSGRQVFRRFAALDDGSDSSFAYMAGFLCHFALDSSCHSYVEEMALLGVSHTLLETQLDRSFLVADGKNPLRQDLVAHIHPSKDTARTVARFFPQLTEAQVHRSIKEMVFYHHLLMAPNQAKRKLLNGAFAVMGSKDTYGGMVMTTGQVGACRQMVTRLRAMYQDALPLAVELIGAWPELGSDQFTLDFNGTLRETD